MCSVSGKGLLEWTLKINISWPILIAYLVLPCRNRAYSWRIALLHCVCTSFRIHFHSCWANKRTTWTTSSVEINTSKQELYALYFGLILCRSIELLINATSLSLLIDSIKHVFSTKTVVVLYMQIFSNLCYNGQLSCRYIQLT